MFDFLTTKKTIDEARTDYRAMMRDSAALEAEIRSTRLAPPTKAEVAALARQWAMTPPPGFDEAFTQRLRDYYAREGATGFPQAAFSALLADPHGMVNAARLDNILRLVAGPQLADVLAAAVNRAEFSNAYGLPAEQRAKKLAKLQAEHTTLKAKITKLVKDCDDSGIDLT